MGALEDTKFLMDKYNIHPNKNLGQNFLIDEGSLNKIAENVSKEDTVVEIGPGLGTITSILLEKAKKVISIELDPKMCEILKDRFKLYNNFELLNEDVLKIDFKELVKKEERSNFKVVANLPYYITTSIITKLIEEGVSDITVLIQKEVADRICATPGEKEAGAITYFVNYYAEATIIGNVSKECFIPNPKVESAIVNIKLLDKKRVKVDNEEIFFKLIKENFTKRRKTILNSLSSTIEKEKLIQILKELNIPENVRGETLTLQDFANIVNQYNKLIN
jgi:16S rRNA (adenine1518-N6/adenine1519-N6)-dimethyltransferase